jgi:molybdopterin-biosynthesis enzyme MoeA-like protein
LATLGLGQSFLTSSGGVTPTTKDTSNVVTAAAANQKFVTVTGYVDNIQTFINRTLGGKKFSLKQPDKKQD